MSLPISRREFISGVAALGGAAAVTGISGLRDTARAVDNVPNAHKSYVPGAWRVPPAAITNIAGTVNCDIVVVGAGMAGLPAAVYAAQQGANVHVLEKGGRYGQHRLCTNGFNADLQTKAGLTFDRESVITDFWKVCNGFQGVIKHYGTYFDNSGPYLNWLESVYKKKGWSILPQTVMGGDAIVASLVNRWWPGYAAMCIFADDKGDSLLTGVNVDWTGYLYNMGMELGATFHVNTPAIQLVRSGTGRVTGVIAQDEIGDYYQYNASKGVLLTTGDCGGNADMLQELNPTLLRYTTTICETKNTGDGHKMGVWIGADVETFLAADAFPFITPMSPVEVNRKGIRPLDNPVFCATKNIGWRPAVASLPVLMVDIAGHRLAAEDLPFQAYSIISLSAAQGRVWSIWDSAWEKKFPANFARSDIMSWNYQDQVDKEVAAGITLKFNSIDDLIAGTKMDATIFKKTLARYHDLCGKGKDTDCFKQSNWLTTIDQPPFYAAQHGMALDSTRGGLKMDDNQNVLDTNALPIPGLYAAGNCAGSFYGNVYPPNIMGSGIGHAQCFGWLAIKNMLGQTS